MVVSFRDESLAYEIAYFRLLTFVSHVRNKRGRDDNGQVRKSTDKTAPSVYFAFVRCNFGGNDLACSIPFVSHVRNKRGEFRT